MSGGSIQGGGGGASKYDASVGSGGDYSDIQAAITGVGGTDIKLLLIGDITEDSDITIPSGASFLLDLSSYTLTMAAHQFVIAGTCDVVVKGNGIDSGAEIDYTQTSGGVELFDFSSYTSSTIEFSNFFFDNNSIGGCNAIKNGIQNINFVKIDLGNYASTGFIDGRDGGKYNHIWLEGGGTNCYAALTPSADGKHEYDNIQTRGSFSTANTSILIGQESVLNNFTSKALSVVIEMGYNSGINNLFADSNKYITIKVKCSPAFISNAYSYAGTDISVDVENEDFISISNCMLKSLDLTDNGATNIKVTNTRINDAVTIAGDRHKFANVEFLGGVSVSSGADNNGILNCQAGVDAGGGANTITVDAGSNNTRIVGCITDAAIVDNGTGTTVSANIVY